MLRLYHNKKPDRTVEEWERALVYFGKAQSWGMPFPDVLAAVGVDNAIWCIKRLGAMWDNHYTLINYLDSAMLCHVAHGDDRPRLAILAMQGYIAGTVSKKEMEDARQAANSSWVLAQTQDGWATTEAFWAASVWAEASRSASVDDAADLEKQAATLLDWAYQLKRGN